jgi:hypothetical protein
MLLPAMAFGADEPVQFNRDIRPILSENCFQCHGPDKNQRKGELRLDVRDDALAKEAFVPGKPAESELIARITSTDANEVMPPPKSNKHLSPAQKELLRRWVAEGAKYEGHWAYISPVKPAVPAGENAIDAIVAKDLAKHGLKLSAEADRRTLARRLSFDLLGLPPRPEEVDAFVNDKSADAYEKLVDRLMASPHYGEKLAISWLDVVRFADTIGYHSDTPRNVYPYRDYVIRAFNDNKPFDQFTVEQLAGDLLPNSTQEQKVASGFNRLLLTTEEGGAQAKDYEARMLGDRVRAVGTVWLGLTLGCCQCHDHKFDPAKARDFYAMGAFFADIQEAIIGGREPGMPVASPEQSQELAKLQAAAAALQKEYDTSTPELVAAQLAWEAQVKDQAALFERWTLLHPETVKSDKNNAFKVESDQSIIAERNPDGGVDTYHITIKTGLKDITGFRLEALPHPSLPAQGPGRAGNGNFVVSEVALATADGKPLKLAAATATFEQNGFPAANTIDGKTEANNGWAVAGTNGKPSTLFLDLAEPLAGEAERTLVFTISQNHGDNHVLGHFRLAAANFPAPSQFARSVLPPKDISDILAIEPAKRNPDQQNRLSAHFRSVTPMLADLRGRLDASRKAATNYENALPKCLVSISMQNPRTVRILPRGNWLDETGEVMVPALPGFLAPPPPADRRLNRLDLAKWIVDPQNPLTARVFVNRLWKQFYGVGLSKTSDDFGSQGEWPTHPELLDWLACEFRDGGWNVRHMVKLIVLSKTYRQVSTAPHELLVRDPENRLLARQSRFRLDAELVRDNALAVSGLLSPKIGGPSALPYQPDGYWENLNFPQRTYQASTSEDQYRRGLYTWWQRSFVHPSMLAFDAPTREECAADRTRSNIPQQALVLLNDPSYVEAARAFATRIVQQPAPDADARIDWAWRQALQRPPRDDERQVVKVLLEKHRARFTEDKAGAEAVLKVGLAPAPADLDKAELAAWTSVARTILNLHETITRN